MASRPPPPSARELAPSPLSLVASPRGWRLTQHGTVLSEILRAPGPTRSVFDLLAVAARFGTPFARNIALLGFGGGGVLAAYRAMAGTARFHGLDLDPTGHDLLASLGPEGRWIEPLQWHHADAAEWLRRTRRRFDVVIDDLSIPTASDVVKPPASWDEIPRLIARRLRPNGLAILNLLPPESERGSWKSTIARIAAPFRHAVTVHLPEYHNRVVLAWQAPRPRRMTRSMLTRGLRDLGSELRVGPLRPVH